MSTMHTHSWTWRQRGRVIIGGLALLFCAAVSAATGVDQTVADLIPKLAAEKVEDRYAPQMELQALALQAGRPGAEAERIELAKVLAAKAKDAAVPQPARVWLVRQLEYIGAHESVPALTALMNGTDPELRECARRALEKNLAPAASDSLRAALKQATEPAWQIGLANALAERRDTAAVILITPLLQRRDTGTASASALAKIASEPALLALWSAYDEGLPVAPDALIAAGNRLVATGSKPRAAVLFNRLYIAGTTNAAPNSPEKKEPLAAVQVRCAALAGIATSNPSRASRLIPAALQDKDASLQFAAVAAAVTTYGNSASDNLLPLLAKASSSAKIYILRVLNPAAEARVIALASDSDENVRVTVFETLARIGGEASVPVLLKAAVDTSSPTQKAAVAALAKISGPGADAAVQKAAGEGEARVRIVAIRALMERNESGSLPALLKYAADPDASVSDAACAALSRLGTDNDIPSLGQLVIDGKTPGAQAALDAVASRSPDKAEAARKLVRLAAAHQDSTALFKTLAVLGGIEALNTVAQSVASANTQTRDAAVRALASWPDFAAVKPLLAIAADPATTQVHNVLAEQGIVRLVKNSEHEPAEARLEAARAAWANARRPEEKKLVLSALESIVIAQTADVLKPLLADPNLKAEAGLAAVKLAEALWKTDKPAAKSLAQAVKDANLSEDTTRKADAILRK